MSALGEMLQIAAATMPIWRDAVMMLLAGIVIGSLWLYASLVGEP